jgi:vancomycin resistance protein YoaR
MSKRSTGTRSGQHGGVLLGIAGGMLVVAGGFVGAYFMTGSRSVASAATTPDKEPSLPTTSSRPGQDTSGLLSKQVELTAGGISHSLTWAELGAEADKTEGGKVLTIDRDKATKALMVLKAKIDRSPIDAHLDLENRKILDDTPGRGLDVWGSLAKLTAAARSGATKVELATIAIPASVTKTGLGIEDISEVMGHWETAFPVSDRDRNFNLKLAASKLNGIVLKPGAEWSFNDSVGERSQKNGYKIAHVITAGEMVDGLAGGTCQISTTLYGAAFFAGIDIVKTTNHSRPSAYTPLGFDATVVWPNTDLKLKNPYDFPVVIRYVVANGQAKAEVLGKKRPYDKIVFTRNILEETPFTSEERLDEEMAEGEQSYDQEGFPGYKILKERHFYKGKELVKREKWVATYKPVTEYIRRGTSTDPNAKKAPQKDSHSLRKPGGPSSSFGQ